MKRFLNHILALLIILLVVPFWVSGTAAQQSETPESQQPGPVDDPIRELNLSPEQREQIRAFRLQTQEERANINRRLRESTIALEQELDADNPNEGVIEQRIRDVAAMQAAQMRMRILSEVRLRQILTPEQRSLWRELRRAARNRRERPFENRREGIQNPRRFPNQRNGLRPALPPANEVPGRQRP
jgi:Spy/CpxP family protein refolding chaperone